MDIRNLIRSARHDIAHDLSSHHHLPQPETSQTSQTIACNRFLKTSFSREMLKLPKTRLQHFKRPRGRTLVRKQSQPFSRLKGRPNGDTVTREDRLLTPRSTLSGRGVTRFGGSGLRRCTTSSGSICSRDYYENCFHHGYRIKPPTAKAAFGFQAPRFSKSLQSPHPVTAPQMTPYQSSLVIRFPGKPLPAFMPPTRRRTVSCKRNLDANVTELNRLLLKMKSIENRHHDKSIPRSFSAPALSRPASKATPVATNCRVRPISRLTGPNRVESLDYDGMYHRCKIRLKNGKSNERQSERTDIFNINSLIHHGCDNFSIVSFNILSQTCLEQHRHDRYTGDPEYHAWVHRLQRIVNLLVAMMPSIICLQEVDLDPIIMRDLEKQFAQYGYTMILQDPKKSSHMPLFVTAVLFQSDKFELLWHESRSRALLVQLRWKVQSRNIFIGNMHLQASPDKADVRLHQARKALHRLETHIVDSEYDIESCPVILCGDFNDDDDSNVADFLHGKLEEPHQFIFEDVEHFMDRFCSAQADKKRLPSYFTQAASYELDFIFYTRTNLVPVAALHALKGAADLQTMTLDPPPNAFWPSDHVPVGCMFTLQSNDIIIQNHR